MAWPIGKLSAENKWSSEKTIEENSSKKKKSRWRHNQVEEKEIQNFIPVGKEF